MTVLLFQHIDHLGYEWTYGDAFRDPDCPYGSRRSLHSERLAIDINLYREGIWLDKTEDHTPLAEFWEGLGGSWGGRFGDGNHYSLEHGGRRRATSRLFIVCFAAIISCVVSNGF